MSADRLGVRPSAKTIDCVRADPDIGREFGTMRIRRSIHKLLRLGAKARFVYDEHPRTRSVFVRAWRWLPWDWRPLMFAGVSATGRRLLRAIKRPIA
jgi:hypothetical protein